MNDTLFWMKVPFRYIYLEGVNKFIGKVFGD